MDAAFPRRAPTWPLLATLGLHLLLAWSWRTAHPPAPDARGERVFDLIPMPPTRQATPAPRVRPQLPLPASTPAPLRGETAPRRSPPASAAPPPEPAPGLREPEAITPPIPMKDAPDDPFAPAAPPLAKEAAAGTALARARRDAVLIDRELRKGKPDLAALADTPLSRMRQTLEGAHRDGRRGLTSETYTAPDGEVIYRFRQGGKTWCRTGGAVGPRIGGAEGGGAAMFDVAGGGGKAGSIRCPSHGDWKRD